MFAVDVGADAAAPEGTAATLAVPFSMAPPAIPSPDFSGPIYQAYAMHDTKTGEAGTTYLTFVFTHGRLTNIVPVPSEPSLKKTDGSGHP